MKFFWLGVFLLTFCFVCEVISDYSDAMLPSKEIRNRVHRTMRVNMRVGKRFGDSEYEDEAPKRRFRARLRTGKRSVNDLESPETDYTDTPHYTDQFNIVEDPSEVNKLSFLNPKRRLKLVFRPGKRNFGNPELVQFYDQPNHDGNFQDSYISAPKRRLRVVVRTGKRNANTPSTLSPQTLIDTAPVTEDTFDPHLDGDYKRSAPQFLLNPRVGKNEKTWKARPIEALHKRSDPKATDLWFGPRIGRSNGEQFEDIPWNYVILNGNRLSNVPTFKNNDADQSNEEATQ